MLEFNTDIFDYFKDNKIVVRDEQYFENLRKFNNWPKTPNTAFDEDDDVFYVTQGVYDTIEYELAVKHQCTISIAQYNMKIQQGEKYATAFIDCVIEYPFSCHR